MGLHPMKQYAPVITRRLQNSMLLYCLRKIVLGKACACPRLCRTVSSPQMKPFLSWEQHRHFTGSDHQLKPKLTVPGSRAIHSFSASCLSVYPSTCVSKRMQSIVCSRLNYTAKDCQRCCVSTATKLWGCVLLNRIKWLRILEKGLDGAGG